MGYHGHQGAIPPPPGMMGNGMGMVMTPQMGMAPPMPPMAPPLPVSVAQMKQQQFAQLQQQGHQQHQGPRPPVHDAVAAGIQQAAGPSTGKQKKKGVLMQAADKRWRDPTLDEWPDNDFRVFVGDMGNEVTDDTLAKAFNHYSSFAKAKIIRDPRTKKSKGFGFVSFLDSSDYAKALKDMDGKYIGNRPCKLSKGSWTDRKVEFKKGKKK